MEPHHESDPYSLADLDSTVSPDQEAHLSAYYDLLREDAVGPLREAVREVHLRPKRKENQPRDRAAIYEKVSQYAERYWVCE